jgi:hypothetical protein
MDLSIGDATFDNPLGATDHGSDGGEELEVGSGVHDKVTG